VAKLSPKKGTAEKSLGTAVTENKDALYKTWAENGEDKRKWTKLQKTETSIIDNEVLVFKITRKKSSCFRTDASRKK
jgi:hypothetical protein